MRVSSLAGLEHGVLAIGCTAAAIFVLFTGLPAPPADFTLPWAIVPIPGFVVAFWLAERYRDRLRHRSGWRQKLGVFLDSIHLVRELFRRPFQHASAPLAMSVFWAADIFAVWAALTAFGYEMNPAAVTIGFGTGLVFTRRTGPLGGAGVLMVILPDPVVQRCAACRCRRRRVRVPRAHAVAAVAVLRTQPPDVAANRPGRRTACRGKGRSQRRAGPATTSRRVGMR